MAKAETYNLMGIPEVLYVKSAKAHSIRFC